MNPERPRTVAMNGRIEFRHVWFAYEKEEYILKDVSFALSRGEDRLCGGYGRRKILNSESDRALL